MSGRMRTTGSLICGVLLAVVFAGLFALQMPVSHAQQEDFFLPEGWQVSPDNTKQPGEAGYEAVSPNGLVMVWVPGGKFMMGSTDEDIEYAVIELGVKRERLKREQPAHEVELDGFWVGKTEVTVAQWRAVMGSVPTKPQKAEAVDGDDAAAVGATEVPGTDDAPGAGANHEHNDQGDDHPVVWVSWDECQEFCEKTGLSLPTEAQWEYAARGPESRRYPWGNDWDPKRLCWGENRGPGGRTVPVGSFAEGASWCGALDMAGNVWEWCADRYEWDYYRQSPARNPTGPATGTYRVVRGGSWAGGNPGGFRCARRLSRDPSSRNKGNKVQGFRCARGLGGGG